MDRWVQHFSKTILKDLLHIDTTYATSQFECPDKNTALHLLLLHSLPDVFHCESLDDIVTKTHVPALISCVAAPTELPLTCAPDPAHRSIVFQLLCLITVLTVTLKVI